MARSLRFDATKREEWARRLEFEIEEAKESRTQYLAQMRVSYQQYRSILPMKTKPWPGCSNLAPPLTPRACEQTVRRVVMHFLQNREYIHLAPNSAAVEVLDRAKKVEHYLRWQAESELAYFRSVDLFERARVIGGTGIAETGWVRDERWVADVLTLGRDVLMPDKDASDGDPVLKYRPNGEPAKRNSPIDEILKELFGSIGFNPLRRRKTGKKKDVEYWDVEYEERENGEEKKAKITIDKSEYLGDDIEVMAEVYRVVKDQPVINPLNIENVIVPAGEFTIQDAPLVAIREYWNYDSCMYELDRGEWYLEAAERERLEEAFVDEEGVPRKTVSYSKADGEDDQRRDDDDYVGVDSDRFRSKKMAVFRIVTTWDLYGDGDYIEAEFYMIPSLRLITRVHYDSANNRSGMRNLVAANYLPVRDQFYGLSLPQFVRGIQTELNTIHNQRVDRASITGNPFMFVDPSAHFERDNILYGPGDLIPLPNPQQNVFVPQFSPSGQMDDLRLEQQLWGYSDDLTAIGSMAVGRSEDRPNAQRTARGAQLLMGQTQQAIEYAAESIRGAVVSLWQQIYAWNASNIPEGKEFRVLGTDEIQAFEERKEFRGSFDFIFDVDSAIMNSEIERYLWTEFFQLTAQASNAQPGQVRRPFVDLCIEMGKRRKIPNPERFFPKVRQYAGVSIEPEVEHQIFMMGRPVETHPEDDVMHHVEVHQQLAQKLMDPEDPIHLPPDGLQYFMEHLTATVRQAVQLTGGSLPAGPEAAAGPPGAQPEAPGSQMMAPNTGPGVEGAAIG